MCLLERSKYLQALSQKKDFDLLRKQACSFSHQWLKAFFLYKDETENLKLAWSLPKQYVSHSVTRNRLKRWGRDNFKKSSLRGLILMVFCPRDQSFYKKLKRKDFDYVFDHVLEKIYSEIKLF